MFIFFLWTLITSATAGVHGFAQAVSKLYKQLGDVGYWGEPIGNNWLLNVDSLCGYSPNLTMVFHFIMYQILQLHHISVLKWTYIITRRMWSEHV